MFETMALLLGAGITAQVVVWTVASVLYPVFCIWMGVDALLRREADYPSGSSNEKLVWVLGIILVNPMAFLYLFLVFAKGKRQPACCPAGYSAA